MATSGLPQQTTSSKITGFAMAQQREQAALPPATDKVGLKGYRLFSDHHFLFRRIFRNGRLVACFDFTVLNGSFGQIANGAEQTTVTFRGAGGTGAKDGFLFALELAPSVILSLGIISITDGLGGLRAAQQLMTPILKPCWVFRASARWRSSLTYKTPMPPRG